MAKLPRIDLNRLEKLKERREAAFAASSKAHDEIRELHRQRNSVEAEIGKAIANACSGLVPMDRRQLAAHTQKLEERRASLTDAMAKARIDNEPLEERRASVGRLYAACAQYAGVQSND